MEEEARVEEEQGQGRAEEERKESRAGEGGEWGQRRLERKERLVKSKARERLRLYRGWGGLVSLRVGASLGLSFPQRRLCEMDIDAFTTHGLSYVKSEECHSRHASLNHNHIIIVMAHIPSTLECNGLCREDRKRSDMVTG